MALIANNLIDSIRSINDQEFEGFLGFPKTVDEAAERWSLAIGNYASLVIPPSVTSEPARQALKAKLMLVDSLGVAAFVNGLTEYATILGGGMQPNFSAVPPPVPIILIPIFTLGFSGASSETIANQLGNIIHGWFKVGTAINNASSATVNWN